MTGRERGRRSIRTRVEALRPQNGLSAAGKGIQIRSLGAIRPYAPTDSTIRGQETAIPSLTQGMPDRPTYANATGKLCPVCKTGMTQGEIDNAPHVSVSVQRMYRPIDMHDDGSTYYEEPVYYKQDYGTRTRAHARPCSTCIDELQGRRSSYVSEKDVRRWLRVHGGGQGP